MHEPSNSRSLRELTLIICTRNRADQLQATLASLNQIVTERRWELVIVDNGSTDSTPEVVRRFISATEISTVKIDEPRKGLSRARNAGCKAAKGAVIAFTDDDCYPHEDYVDAVLDIFDRRPDLGFMGGRVLLHDPSDAAITIRETSEPKTLDAHRLPIPGFILGANMAFRGEVLEDIGLFDECMGAGTRLGSGEDVDLCARATNRGWSGGYFPTPTVRHHHRRKYGPEIDSLRRRYALGRGAYYGKTLLEHSTLRHECLKELYWRVQIGLPWRRAAREAWGALQYVVCRVLTGRFDSTM